ncbi:MAG: tetratricopeptide repeat protein [Deltaproteobacteria bacterium]|jgi:hypothetical protein|nr:tetratricopeptide repeat protein [Deltaproteobacteria bacterium]
MQERRLTMSDRIDGFTDLYAQELLVNGTPDKAVTYLTWKIKSLEDDPEGDLLDISSAEVDLGILLYIRRDYKEAEVHLLSGWSERKLVLGPQHPDTAKAKKIHGYALQAIAAEAFKRQAACGGKDLGSLRPQGSGKKLVART